MKKALKLFLLLSVCALFTAGALSFKAWQWLNTLQPMPESFAILDVQKGDTLYSLGRELHQRGVLAWPKMWVQYARLTQQTHIKAGEYALEREESPLSLLLKINSGDVVSYQMTLVEGMTFKEYVERIQAHKKIKTTFDYAHYAAALKAAGIELDHPEGWFYPDTYRFLANDSDMSILQRAHEKMKNILFDLWPDRDQNLPYSTAYEALIMASIIEKETGVAYERGEISGVFVRRLEKKMRLQTDPTIIYGMGERYTGNITRKNLREPTAYNTYVIKGLPPTPIANPGADAIYAALHPLPGNTLYFVAKGDGSHHFSSTIQEHNAAVRKYQKRRRQDYRSSPGKSE